MNRLNRIPGSRFTQSQGRQRGQAMTEFIVAMVVIVPLFFGVVYIGKYSDIKHQAIQASRYAAMERAMDPSSHESDSIVKNATIARFFSDNGQHQKIGHQDTPAGSTASDGNPNWFQATKQHPSLIANFSDVSVDIKAADNPASLNSTFTALSNLAAENLFSKLPKDGAVQADVQVSLANVTHFAPLQNINIKLGARTVIAGNPWNAGGARDVADHFPKSPLSAVPARGASFLSSIPGVGTFFSWFAGTDAPTPGCIKPEIVPASVLEKNVSFDSTKSSGDNACL